MLLGTHKSDDGAERSDAPESGRHEHQVRVGRQLAHLGRVPHQTARGGDHPHQGVLWPRAQLHVQLSGPATVRNRNRFIVKLQYKHQRKYIHI